MKFKGVYLLIISFFLSFYVPMYSAQQTASKKKLSLKEASEKNMIDYRLSGTDGSHYGDCMVIVLHSNVDSNLVLQLLPGTQLIPNEYKYQTMIITKSATLELPAHSVKSYNIYAMCGEYYDDPPSESTIYSIGDMASRDIVKLANYLYYNEKQNYKGQYALWAVADQIGNKELEKYGATSIDINDVLQMVDEIKIPVKLNHVEIKQEEKAKEKVKSIYKRKQAKTIYKSISQKPTQIKAKSKTAIEKYGFGGLGVITVLSGFLYFTLRKKGKNKNKNKNTRV